MSDHIDIFDEDDLNNLAQFWSSLLTKIHKERLLNQVIVIRAYTGGTSCVQTDPYQEAIRVFLAEATVAEDYRR
jgi:ribonucleotide reductase alpha subunit